MRNSLGIKRASAIISLILLSAAVCAACVKPEGVSTDTPDAPPTEIFGETPNVTPSAQSDANPTVDYPPTANGGDEPDYEFFRELYGTDGYVYKFGDFWDWYRYDRLIHIEILYINRVDTGSLTINTNFGFFQAPYDTLEDGYDNSRLLHYHVLRESNMIYLLELAPDATFYFKSVDKSYKAEPEKLNGIEDFADKVKEGYRTWEAEAEDGVIISMTNIPWREQIIYKIYDISVISEDRAFIRAQPLKLINAPFIVSTHRIDELGLPVETLVITSETAMFAIDYELSGIQHKSMDIDYLSHLLQKYENAFIIYADITKNGNDAVEIRQIYTP